MAIRPPVAITAVYLLLLVPLGCDAPPPSPPVQAAEETPIGMQLPASQAAESKNILMLVGDENGTVLPGTSIADVFVRNRLQLDMGHTVTILAHDTEADQMLTAANAADLVIIAESVGSGTIGTKVVSTPTPIFSYEAFLQDEFGLVNPEGLSVDPGSPDTASFGAIAEQTSITIVNPDHPLAAGFEGTVQVYRFPREMNWGKEIAPSAEIIATLADYPDAAVVYLLRRGSPTFDGTPAAGLRLQYFTENDNDTGTINLMTGDGLRLFDAAVNYALTTDP